MTTAKFSASTQYGDWKGTVSADNVDNHIENIYEILEKKSDFEISKDALLGIQFYSGEYHGGEPLKPRISAVVMPASNFDDAAEKLQNNPDPIPSRVIELELDHSEFLCLFKRFSITLTKKGLDLQDREYHHED